MADCLQQEPGDALTFGQLQGGMFFWSQLAGANGKPVDATPYAKRAANSVVFVQGEPFLLITLTL